MLYIRRSAPYYLSSRSAPYYLSSRSSGVSLLLVPGVVSRTDFFCLQLHFRGSVVFTDDWAMVLATTLSASPLLVFIFLLLYEISLLASVTGRSYVACSVLTVSASDAVLRVCFGIL